VQETYTVPDVAVTGNAGSPTITGHVPPGAIATTVYNEVCSSYADDNFTLQVQANGTFSHTFAKPLLGGAPIGITVFPGKGDVIRLDGRLPGEAPCINVFGVLYPQVPGAAPNPTPYYLSANNFYGVTGARIVLRRGGTVISDNTNALATSSAGFEIDKQPLPGDVVELYRPHTAPQPTSTFTLPNVRAVYDTSNSLVAVDAPPALALYTSIESHYSKSTNSRSAMNTTGGRTLFNYAIGEGYDPPADLKFAWVLTTTWNSPDGRNTFFTGSVPGDLAAPVISVKLASKFKLSKLGSSFAASITSSEAANAKVTITLPAKLKTSAKSKAKGPTTIASAKVTLKAGTVKVKVKLTKSGKKLLKKIRKKKLPSQTATFTVTATDGSGNAATKVKTTKLAAK
jgi:hypothetical protein